ncbi:MAG: hypothetical protein J0G98_01640 [Terrimonas ferruginea]|uniref:hypothetical protein n=1 Tax=Terrimonas ferruginea TaxID=249 RepID=UPI000A90E435|nr:hypothetical protein [Terrimonas ferruginea]MBN8781739.1 hypothetical protein [Terrimonas ferruginea]
MLRKFMMSASLVASLLAFAPAFSQNVTIVYSSSSLSNINSCPSCCNVFNMSGNNPTAGGRPHYPVSGGATFDGTSIRMGTRVDPSAGISSGTAYAIGYTFKIGYNYAVTVDMGYTATPSTAFPKLTLSTRTALPNPNDTDPIVCGPVNNSKWISSIGITKAVVYPSQQAVQTYSPSAFSVSAQQNYLVLTISDGGASTTTALINKVTITETASASFSISSSISSLACGATTPADFTVNNVGGSTGITGYTWNLGANNGWLYQGSPAPPTIGTGGNTLQLVPDCGKALSSVSATVAANGNNYNTSNNITIAVSQPSYLLDGASSLCSGSENYSITGMVCNSTVLWEAPPSPQATLSSLTTSPTILTYAGTSGNFTLKANVTSCGVTIPVTKPIHVGAYTSSDYTLTGNNGSIYWCPNQSMSYYVGGQNASNYNWTVPTGWTTLYNGGSYIAIKAPSGTYPPTGSIDVSFTEPCGATLTKSQFMAYSSSGCTNPCYTYSPNPAPYYLNVNVASGCIGSTYIRKIELVRASTGVSVYYQDYSFGNVTSTSITMTSYPSGNYYLRIYDGSSWSSYNVAH